jgi:nucleoside-diphosphate-sugar epimerase
MATPAAHTGQPVLAGKAVLVTGATGFIGSRLAEQLAIEEGAAVTGIGRSLARVAELRGHGVDLVALDLLDPSDLRHIATDVVNDKEVVFHAAAVLDADPKTAQAVNVDATERLVRAAGQAGARRFVHVSTVGVYDMADRSVVDESTPLATRYPATYPRTKAQAEKRAFACAREVGIELTAVRPSMVYGPGHGVWTTTMARNVCDGNPVFLGDGSAHFNPVYLDDVVDGLVRCATSPHAPGEAFNLSAEVTTWREFMGYYGALCGKEPKGLPLWMARLMVFASRIPGVNMPVDEGFIEMATSRKRFSTKKARELLGWQPTVALDEGMKRTAWWLEEQGIV